MQMGHLSGGQKTRVVFGILTKTEPHLIVLDVCRAVYSHNI